MKKEASTQDTGHRKKYAGMPGHRLLEDSFEDLQIHGDDRARSDEDAASAVPEGDKAPNPELASSASAGRSVTSPQPRPNILVCDAWFGFPRQKRPRKERINAVSRQLSNFLRWRSEASGSKRECLVSLLGGEGDVQAVRDRMNEIDGRLPSAFLFGESVTIHEYLDQQKSVEVAYLSPDAQRTLPTTSPPPDIVIVGMLIDRRIAADRSRRRAEEGLNLNAVKLPLDELDVRDLSSREPLNVDAAMELMQRWWWNCERVEKQRQRENPGENNEHLSTAYRKCFLEAAAWAMKSHRERHPNRTVHLSKRE